ncbi:MAG: peptidoglycan bridge formation glycyltransferase FemA/FemB family protein [Candidatus Woesebacteria bacterium]|jgi:lipid II:glycine glycyltransferase (peptidoglycan interpeptide bridge formation enzyme)
MLIRPLREEEKDLHNSVVTHPLQSWQWGEFRKNTGLNVQRIGFFINGQIQDSIQVSFHSLPFFNKNVGYFPKGNMPNESQISALKQLAKENDAVFIKMEPNVCQRVGQNSAHSKIKKFLENHNSEAGRPLFTKHTFQIDLTQPEEDIFADLSSKTRYNTRLAHKKGVKIYENTSLEGLEQYLEILGETTHRQEFYAHQPDYFYKMWDTLGNNGIMRIFNAVYQEQILVSWIMFIFNNILYYPYGASRSIHREVMASNLMMWEMIKFGQQQNCYKFDMWGSLGPNPDKKHPWYGFHRFKKGYGGQLMEFLGTYDLIHNYPFYKIFRITDDLRWKYLRLKAKFRR